MEYSIRELLERHSGGLDGTDYVHSESDMLDFRLFSKDLFECRNQKLRFKECVTVMDYFQTAQAFPPFEGVNYKSRKRMPYFTDNLNTFAEAADHGERIAVEGGPCLFGEYEVSVEIQLQDGSKKMFDYANGKSYLSKETADHHHEMDQAGFSETESMADYLRQFGSQLAKISFQSEKQGLTPQEYLGLCYPFEIASNLGGPLVIPIPDMSYRKYLISVLEYIPEKLREQTLEAFDAVTSQIIPFYLEAIEKLQKHFQIRDFLCIHGECHDLLETWYQKRSPYIERKRVLKNLSRLPEKIESIKDYISMPALPFYFFGAEKILEVNSVDETDAYRKCKKAHRSAEVQMGCILYPELLSGDEIHTYYNAPTKWKEYGTYDTLADFYWKDKTCVDGSLHNDICG